jgi:hypothetical protein
MSGKNLSENELKQKKAIIWEYKEWMITTLESLNSSSKVLSSSISALTLVHYICNIFSIKYKHYVSSILGVIRALWKFWNMLIFSLFWMLILMEVPPYKRLANTSGFPLICI